MNIFYYSNLFGGFSTVSTLNSEARFVHDGRMNVIMNIQQIKTFEQVRQFLISTADNTITPPSKDEGYRWAEHTLKHFRYSLPQSEPIKG